MNHSTTDHTTNPKKSRGWKLLEILLRSLALLVAFWALAALWIDAHPGFSILMLGFILAGWICLPKYRTFTLLGAWLLVVAWWVTLKPSNSRDWSPEYSRLPSATTGGDVVTFLEVRDFIYPDQQTVKEQWTTRQVHLSNLRGVDYIQNYWGSKLIAHPLASFDFGEEGRICFSVETRRESHEGFSAIKGFFRQFELICLVGEERDFLGKRALPGGREEMYVYSLNIGPEESRDLFLHYVSIMNALKEQPQWYHAVTANCTTALKIQRKGNPITNAMDWKILLNGYFDRWIYDQGLMGKDVPFETLKQKRRVDEIGRSLASKNLSAQEFSRAIRQGF